MANSSYTYKSDIWSLGIIFYELLFNDLPWVANDCDALLRKIKSESLNFKKNGISISSESIHLLQLMLVFDESKRASWDEIVEAAKNLEIRK